MPSPEYLAPVLTVVGLPALIFMVMRNFPQAARGVVLLLAGVIAIMTRDPKRRAACYKVLNTITRQDERRRLSGLRTRQAIRRG
jgi:hypothetical protein